MTWWGASLALLLAAGVDGADLQEGTCPAGGCDSAQRRHFWPNVRGTVGSYGVSDRTVPKDLSKPSWRWHHPSGQYGTVIVGGPLIDDENHLYITEVTAVMKFNANGEILWRAEPPPGAHFPDGPALMGDFIYQSTNTGMLCKFSLSAGQMMWCKQYYRTTGRDSKFVTAHSGIVVMGTDNAYKNGGGSWHVVAVDGDSGDRVWDYRPDVPTWNNMAVFTEDDTLILQDWDANVYCLGLHNGTLLWKAGGRDHGTWTDGGALVGANGIVYAVGSQKNMEAATKPFGGGRVHSYNLSNGRELWSQGTVHGVYTWPVAGKLGRDDRWSVVVASGAIPPCVPWRLVLSQQWDKATVALPLGILWAVLCCFRGGVRWFLLRILLLATLMSLGAFAATALWVCSVPSYPSTVSALDAQTGALRWQYEPPIWEKVVARGDEEGWWSRRSLPWRRLCCPASFGSPGVDGNGVVVIGHLSGMLLAIQDSNEDGTISPSEVQSFDAEAAFLHSGPAFSPGIFAVTTCDSLWVWKMPPDA